MAKTKNIKTMNIRLPYETYVLLKKYCLKADCKMNPVIIDLVESLRKKNEKKVDVS